LFELIGWFEVAWRNNIDRAICAGRGPEMRHWLFDRTFPLQPRTWGKVSVAMRSVGGRTRRPLPGQVIAELTLGFWRFTARGYWTTIWRTHLSHAFPHAPRRPQAALMDRQLDEDMVAIGSWISPVMAAWWRERTAAWRVLANRP
jgi:hypothetical protein